MDKFLIRINTFKRYRPLLEQLVIKDVKLKYRRSFLGYIWSILNPLMIMLIMVLVFSHMFRAGIPNFPAYLIIGQSLFGFMQESTNKAMWSITGNAALLKKTYVPKYIFTMATVTSSFVNMLFSLGAMVLVFVVTGVHPNRYMFFIPFILLQEFVFCLGLGMFLAQGTVFFRDIQYIYSAFLTAWMYATPLFYPIEQLPVWLQKIIKHLNPMYAYITQFRQIALNQTFPDPRLILYGTVIAVVMMLFGTWCFMRNQDKFILYI